MRGGSKGGGGVGRMDFPSLVLYHLLSTPCIEKILAKGGNNCNVLVLLLEKYPKVFLNSCIHPNCFNIDRQFQKEAVTLVSGRLSL